MAYEPDQIERVLRWIRSIIFLALIFIAAMAGGRPSGGLHFFAVASLAGVAALAAGGALGLLFGLPTTTGRVTVVANGADGTKTETPVEGAHRGPAEDWYRDNTSLEQIAQWLTAAIVALSLANFDSWMSRFDRLATGVTCAMYSAPPPAATAPARPPAAAPDPSFDCRDGEPTSGGLVLGAGGILGFIVGYLWARRYLMGALAGARGDLVAKQRKVQAEEKAQIDGARAANLIQLGSRSGTATGEAQRALNEISGVDNDSMGGLVLVSPGTVKDDPWKGQFNGRSMNDSVALNAQVRESRSIPGSYIILFTVAGRTAEARSKLAGTLARIYLHPTFRDPVRAFTFNATGEISLKLVAQGSFTIGVQLVGDVRLELDLAELPDVPDAFRAN